MKKHVSIAMVSAVALLGSLTPAVSAAETTPGTDTAATTTATAPADTATSTDTPTEPSTTEPSGNAGKNDTASMKPDNTVEKQGSSKIVDPSMVADAGVGSAATFKGHGSSIPRVSPEVEEKCKVLDRKVRKDERRTREEQNYWEDNCRDRRLPLGLRVSPEGELAIAIFQAIVTVTGSVATAAAVLLNAFPNLKNDVRAQLARVGIRI